MPASRRSARSLRRSLLPVLVAGLLLVAVAAVPAGAKGSTKPGGSGGGATGATVTMTLGPSAWFSDQYPGCSFDATYTWSGLKTRGLTLAVDLYDGNGALLTRTPQVNNVPLSGTFTFIYTWKDGAGGSPTAIYARGVLLSNGVEVSGTAAVSPVTSESCTGPLSVGWVSTIPLT